MQRTPAGGGQGGSWMLPEAQSDDLLYVSSGCSGTCNVYVFSYPGAKPVGVLSGFVNPGGLCSDRKGNVWITEAGAGDVVEYAHGGTKPIAKLKDSLYPQACSVDPATGDLAVANQSYSMLGIYRHARGQPKLYMGYGAFAFSCTYDGAGDVFLAAGAPYNEAVDWVPKGGSKAKRFPMKPHIYPVGGVLWHGQYLTAVNKEYQLVRYVRAGQGAKLVDIISLDYSTYLSGYWIQGAFVVGATSQGVTFWKYPAGGSIVKTITSVPSPAGVTVSVVPPDHL